MPLNNRLKVQGNWLFRWRSYLPIFFLFLFVPAFLSYSFPMDNHLYEIVWGCFCLGVGLFGLSIRVLTVGFAPKNTSGRNTRTQVADSLNTKGMYSLTRNPLYLGNFFMWFAPILFLHTWWLCVIYVLAFTLYYERIVLVEESFLTEKFGDEYIEWASRTPTFLPRRFRWEKPDMSFSWKTVIRREYHGFYGLVAALTAMEIIAHVVEKGTVENCPVWIGIFALGTLIYGLIRYAAKRTTLLNVDGR